jgi:hypothetical protein
VAVSAMSPMMRLCGACCASHSFRVSKRGGPRCSAAGSRQLRCGGLARG